ncbi:adventurous gliding motility protein GltG [Hyalangium minutum]|uniref:FHA domain containing protein n=1 Tax=Hyalangium minutum TaxID=394096 RepID=A0A085WUU9_9BACT|nr:adventurous gliding motility protein GltG [Hyalangium minutum]KFE71462.1 FHA domain containing protein [Hyalangium minutum]
MAIPLTLKVFKGETLVTSQDFARDIIKIGRLSSAHLRLDDEKVSRVHSVIEVAADGSLSIIDMGSVEGTYVNGKRVNKGRISFGDEIRLGETTLRLENPAAVAAMNVSAAVASTNVAVVTQAPAPVIAQASPVAVETSAVPETLALAPSMATTAQNETVPTEAQAPHTEPAAPVRRSHTSGPLGASLSFVWVDQRVGEFFLPPGQKKSFSVGTAEGVDFVMGDSRLGSPKLEVLRTDGHTYTVCFTGKMKGELIRNAETLDLEAVIESGKASHEDSAYTLALEPDDVFWVDLGGVALEVCFQPVPKRVHVPLSESVDYRALNILLLMLFASSMFIIGALNRTGDEEAFADELSGDHERLTKLIIKPPEPQPNRFLAQLNDQKARQQPKQPVQPSTSEPKKPIRKQTQPAVSTATPSNPKDTAQRFTKNLFSGKGSASLFGNSGGNSDLRNAISNVRNVALGSNGPFGGLMVKGGSGGPSTGGSTIGLDGIRTAGRAGGNDGYGQKVPGLTGKESVDPTIAPVEFKVNEGSLDRELVRKVIQDNKNQIRSCFERQLNQDPDLNGKVQTQFTIGPDGRVLEAKVAQSTTGNAELDACVASRVRLWMFPKPKGGGTVVVSYPFIFKQAGK